MNILVTGSEGFIGRHFCSYLKEMSHDVIGLDRKNGQHITPSLLSDHRTVDGVVHLAALASVDDCEFNPEESYFDNVLLTANVAEYCVGFKIPLLHVSTAYGTAEIINKSTYARHKSTATIIVSSMPSPRVIIRPGCIFGPNSHSIVDKLIAAYHGGDKINLYANGKCRRSYTHVDTLCRQLYANLLPSISGAKFNRSLSAECHLTTKEIAGYFPDPSSVCQYVDDLPYHHAIDSCVYCDPFRPESVRTYIEKAISNGSEG